jgi:hypothetical protein
MMGLGALYNRWFGPYDKRFDRAQNDALIKLNAVVAAGKSVDAQLVSVILAARDACKQRTVTRQVESDFYEAYAKLSDLAKNVVGLSQHGDDQFGDPFEKAINDAEELLKFAAETGIDISLEISASILAARAAFKSGELTNEVRAAFYAGYAGLAKQFGDVTAETIRNCSSPETHRRLDRSKQGALFITGVIAVVSVITFVTGSISTQIVADIASANDSAAKLRAGLSSTDGKSAVTELDATTDPCDLLRKASERKPLTTSDIEQLQQFASTIRGLHSRAIKLNRVVLDWECDPFGICRGDDTAAHNDWVKNNPEKINDRLQLNPALVNYTAEVLCRIQTYQQIRTFATNTQTNYAAIIGAFLSYALPIAYAWLGAFAYQLRLFGDTIRKRTYHPSFADSARMITAVIAGAISGLFNPALGISFSPLATAFLVGYGVELFFKFLDTVLNSFGSGAPAKSAAQ